MPFPRAIRHRQCPVKQVAKMSKDLTGSASRFGDTECGEFDGRTAQDLPTAIRQSSNCVSQQLTASTEIFCRRGIHTPGIVLEPGSTKSQQSVRGWGVFVRVRDFT